MHFFTDVAKVRQFANPRLLIKSAVVEFIRTYKKYLADTFTYEEDNGAAVVKKNNIPFMTELMTDGSTVELEYRTIELKNATNSTFLYTSTLLKVEKDEHPTADEVKNAQ